MTGEGTAMAFEQGGAGSEYCDSDGEGGGDSRSRSMVLKAHDLKVRVESVTDCLASPMVPSHLLPVFPRRRG